MAIFSSCMDAPKRFEKAGIQIDSTRLDLPLYQRIKDTITFTEHIAPIIFENCTPCHREGQSAPFSLLSYEDVAKRSDMIQYVTEIGYMPPWPADADYSSFIGEKELTALEIALIQNWTQNGKQEGPREQLPPLPDFPKDSWLGEPDLVVQMADSLLIEGNNRDHFFILKLPFELEKDTFLRAIEFVPENKRLLHHMNGHLFTYDGSKKELFKNAGKILNAENDLTWQQIYSKLSLFDDSGGVPNFHPLACSYLPGVLPSLYPEGIGGYHLKKKNAFYVNDLHFGPSPVKASDFSHFNLFFSAKPPARPTLELQLGTLGISDIVPPLIIPPDTVMTFSTRGKVFNDISLLSVTPHMHLLGKKIWAYALTETGDTIPIINIPEWDFKWQYTYTFKKMLRLPKNATIIAHATYDNTADNPNNPFDPPQTVAERDGSMRTTDEMFQLILTFVPYQPGDEQISLESELYQKR